MSRYPLLPLARVGKPETKVPLSLTNLPLDMVRIKEHLGLWRIVPAHLRGAADISRHYLASALAGSISLERSIWLSTTASTVDRVNEEEASGRSQPGTPA